MYTNFPQIVMLPNMRIVDFGVGFTGSAHDSSAWKHTRLYQEHATLLSPGEWVWGDSAYPVFYTIILMFFANMQALSIALSMAYSSIQKAREYPWKK
jgi:hypothetical protein